MAFVIGAADQVKQEDGIWVNWSGSEFLIAYARNIKYTKAVTRLRKPYERQIKKETLDNDTAEKLLCQAMAEGLLVDWKNVYDADGVAVKFDKSIAMEALRADPDFREFVLETANNFDAFKRDDIKEVTKKS